MMSNEGSRSKSSDLLSGMATKLNNALGAHSWLDIGVAAGTDLSKNIGDGAEVVIASNAAEVDGFPQGVLTGLRRAGVATHLACVWLRFSTAMGERLVAPYGEYFDPKSAEASTLVIATPRAMPLSEQLMIAERFEANVGVVRLQRVVLVSPFLGQDEARAFRSGSVLPSNVQVHASPDMTRSLPSKQFASLRWAMSSEPLTEARTMPEALIRRTIELRRIDPTSIPERRRPRPID